MRWLVRLSILVACIVVVFWGVDIDKLLATLAGYPLDRIAWIVAFSFIAYSLLAVRLRTLVADPALRLRDYFQASMVGLGVNNLIPARLGEIAKVVYLRHHTQAMRSGAILTAVFWERFLDLHALLILVGVWLVVRSEAAPVLPLVVAVAFLWGVIFIAQRNSRRINRWLARLPSKRIETMARDALGHIGRGLDPNIVGQLTLTTVGIWFVYAAQLSLVLVWVAGIPLDVEALIIVFVISTVGMILPLSPGAIGVYEALLVMALGWYDVVGERALAAALVAHMVQYIPTTLWAGVVIATSRLPLLSAPPEIVSGEAQIEATTLEIDPTRAPAPTHT
ncbi:MAG: lysylphosphatidylglycerol synthase transmembrane domain-containing protein [Pseudomonadota bacterium]